MNAHPDPRREVIERKRVLERAQKLGLAWTELPQHLLNEARMRPRGWVYVIDGDFGPDEAVPPERIRGAWTVDEAGYLTGEYQPNPNFRPRTAQS